MKFIKLITAIAIFATTATLNAKNEFKKDPVTGLIIDKGIEDVKENCTVCHIGRFIIINGGDERYWKYKILVMQNAFGLWKLDPKVKKRITKYLAKHYSKKHNISLEDD